MALQFFDGCGEYYPTAQLHRVWDSIANATVLPTSGRRSGACIRLGATTHHIGKSFPQVQSIVAAFALSIPSLPAGDSIIGRFYGAGVNHLNIYIDSLGHIGVERGSTELVETTAVITGGTYYYLEVKVLISNTVGTVDIQIDGVNEASGTGLDTNNSGTDVVDAVYVVGYNASQLDVDDFYIVDTSGLAPWNDFLGDVRADMVLPNGDGTTSDFDTTFPASPTTHSTKVDENPATDDTDYNETNTPNDIDLFDYAAVPTIAGASGVLGVKSMALARKTNAGTANMRLVTRPVSTNFNGPSEPLGSDYRYHFNIWEDNPETSSVWTDATINAAQFGIEAL